MESRRTLITGVASPVGTALLQAFLAEGARVLATDAEEARVEEQVAALGLEDCDDVITRGLDDSSLGSWWDLSNLIAAFYDELDVFVHVPEHDAASSLPLAIDRLKQALWNAADSGPDGACVVLIAGSSEAALERAGRELARDGAPVRIHAVEPGTPASVAKRVVELVGQRIERSQS
jgi:NAD(P)-dependent dehydrogenase (short-subunit alcohol dehydrogenase family)